MGPPTPQPAQFPIKKRILVVFRSIACGCFKGVLCTWPSPSESSSFCSDTEAEAQAGSALRPAAPQEAFGRMVPGAQG